MGMTDKQFNGFIRLLINDIEEALEEPNEEKRKEKFEKMLKSLQTTLED